jgi:hypothetical protein
MVKQRNDAIMALEKTKNRKLRKHKTSIAKHGI